MSQLITRDGKVIPELGSWEKEQLKKNPIPEYKPENTGRRVNTRGRQRQTVEENPLLYISIPKPGNRYKVYAKHFSNESKSFFFKDYASQEAALEAAQKWRDDLMKGFPK